MVDLTTAEAGEAVADFIIDGIATAQRTAPRTLQAKDGVLGMSALGGCREFIRATVAGDPMETSDQTNWPAYVGTAVGDLVETDLKKLVPGTVTQRRVTLFLQVGDQTISVSGSTDILFPDPVMPGVPPAVVDLKTRDGLGEVRREGPGFKEKAQIAGYLLASIDEGILPAEAIGILIYLDRSGRDRGRYAWTVNREQALLIMETVQARLAEIAADLAAARRSPRDEPESWCFYTGCPFYTACWAGYQPSGAIEDQESLEAIRVYVEGRRDSKDATNRMRSSSQRLQGVTGVTPDGITLNWILQENGSTRIDLREPKE